MLSHVEQQRVKKEKISNVRVAECDKRVEGRERLLGTIVAKT